MIRWITTELLWCTIGVVIMYWVGFIETPSHFYKFIIGWFIGALLIKMFIRKPKENQ